MRAVDTNAVVRLIVRDDPRQAVAADAFIATGGWVSCLTLAEVAWVLRSSYDFAAPEIVATIQMLLQHDKLAVQDPDAVSAALEQFRARPALGFADCMMLEIARKAGHLPLGTFDRELAKLPDTQHL
jgi:predicted nucleic-acid-binding protein